MGGIPGKILRYRFDEPIVEKLLELQWWNYGLTALDGVDFTDIHEALPMIEHNITAGIAQPYEGTLVNMEANGETTIWRYDPEKNELVKRDR